MDGVTKYSKTMRTGARSDEIEEIPLRILLGPILMMAWPHRKHDEQVRTC